MSLSLSSLYACRDFGRECAFPFHLFTFPTFHFSFNFFSILHFLHFSNFVYLHLFTFFSPFFFCYNLLYFFIFLFKPFVYIFSFFFSFFHVLHFSSCFFMFFLFSSFFASRGFRFRTRLGKQVFTVDPTDRPRCDNAPHPVGNDDSRSRGPPTL